MISSMLNSGNKNSDPDAVRKKFYVKYMVCLRDKLLLKSILDDQGIKYNISAHGAIECYEDITEVQINEIRKSLAKSGLILLDENESKLIDRIINSVVEVVHNSNSLPKLSFSDLINEHLVSGNESILKIFSDVKGMSVLQFIVTQKIERAKELLLYEDLSLEEIADILHYKNKNLLIAQFKKFTGLTPAYFKRLRKERKEIADENTYSFHSDATGVSAYN